MGGAAQLAEGLESEPVVAAARASASSSPISRRPSPRPRSDRSSTTQRSAADAVALVGERDAAGVAAAPLDDPESPRRRAGSRARRRPRRSRATCASKVESTPVLGEVGARRGARRSRPGRPAAGRGGSSAGAPVHRSWAESRRSHQSRQDVVVTESIVNYDQSSWSCASSSTPRRSPATATSPAPPRSCTSPSRRSRTRSAGSRRELGTELFERTSRRVVPTEAGEAVAARARRVLAELDGIRGEVDELRGLVRGRVSIGALLPAGEVEVTDAAGELQPGLPGDRGQPARGHGRRHARAARGRPSSTSPSRWSPATRRRASSSSSSARRRWSPPSRPGGAPAKPQVNAADLAAEALATPRSGSAIKLVARRVLRARRPVGCNVSLESGDPYLIRCLVSDGFGAAILPASITRRAGPPVETRPLSPPLRLPVCLAWRRGRHRSAAATALIEFVRAETAGLSG